jgi:hypothetical protein
VTNLSVPCTSVGYQGPPMFRSSHKQPYMSWPAHALVFTGLGVSTSKRTSSDKPLLPRHEVSPATEWVIQEPHASYSWLSLKYPVNSFPSHWHAPRRPCATDELCDGHLPGALSRGFPSVQQRSVDRAAFSYRSLRKIVRSRDNPYGRQPKI